MVKHFVLFWILLLPLWPDALDDKIRNFVDENRYAVHQKLISLVFKDRQQFYTLDGRVDVYAVTRKLKENGLLNLFFDLPRELHVTFKTEEPSLLFTKTVSDSLKAMGYYYFLTKEASSTNEGYHWTVSFDTEYAVDPTLFIEDLQKRGAFVTDIVRETDDRWVYDIGLGETRVPDAAPVAMNEKIRLSRPVDDYWLQLDEAGKLSVYAGRNPNWYPYVVFYDTQMHILSIHKSDIRKKSMVFTAPEETRFVKISDVYSITNLKNGLSISLRP